MDHFEFYPYLQGCADSLEENKDQPSDVALAHMVRLQSVVDKVNKALPRGDNPGFIGTETHVPTYMAMKVLQSDLADCKASWPDQLKNNTTLTLQHLAAEVFLYETVTIEYLKKRSPMDKMQTLEMLNNCMLSIQAYLSLYRTIPQSHYAYFPFTTWMQCGLVLQAAVELSFFEHVGWDLAYVRSSLDLLSFIDWEMAGIQAIVNMRRTGVETLDNKDIFTRFLRRKQNMKSAYEQHIAAELQTPGTDQSGQPPQDWGAMAAGAFPSMEDIYMGGLQYDFETAFWQDFGLSQGTWPTGANGISAPGTFLGQ